MSKYIKENINNIVIHKSRKNILLNKVKDNIFIGNWMNIFQGLERGIKKYDF